MCVCVWGLLIKTRARLSVYIILHFLLISYYLKNTKNIETLVPDDLAAGILRECQVSLLQLLPAEVAIQLTLRDFQLFQNIPPTEYINDLFELESRTGSPNLSQFSDVSRICHFSS